MEIIKTGKTIVITNLKESDLREREERIRPLLNILVHRRDMPGSEKIGILLMLIFVGCRNFDEIEDLAIDEESLTIFVRWLSKNDHLKLADGYKGYVGRNFIYRFHLGFVVERCSIVFQENVEWFEKRIDNINEKEWKCIRKIFAGVEIFRPLKRKAKEICEKYNLGI